MSSCPNCIKRNRRAGKLLFRGASGRDRPEIIQPCIQSVQHPHDLQGGQGDQTVSTVKDIKVAPDNYLAVYMCFKIQRSNYV